MRKRIFLPAVLLVLPLASAVAQQQPPPLEPGQRVRVTAPDINKYDGTLQAMRGDTLTVDTLRIAVASVTRLDVYRGQKSNLLLGMGIGFAAGAGLGALLGAAVDCEDYGFSDQSSCVGLAAAGGAVVGLLVGTTAGLLIKTDRWEEVPLDQIRVSFMPQRDGFALGISVAF